MGDGEEIVFRTGAAWEDHLFEFPAGDVAQFHPLLVPECTMPSLRAVVLEMKLLCKSIVINAQESVKKIWNPVSQL